MSDITLRDIFDVAWTITRVEITARDPNLRLLHIFWIGEQCDRDHLPRGCVRSWEQGEMTLSDRSINVHGDAKGKLPEMGWGYKNKSIPEELMDAEVTRLSMNSRNGISCVVSIDVTLQPLTVDKLKAEMREDT